MIIISIFGGLGNQMFQYACGKAIAEKLGVDLKLDVSLLANKTECENFTIRDYELGVFEIKDEIISVNEVRKFIPDLWSCTKAELLKYKLIRLLNRNHYYFEKRKYQFEPQINQLKDNSYIYGYFQTEKYFSNIKNELLQAFNLKDKLNLQNEKLKYQLQNENSVSIHIRRGDYHNSPFNLLELSYYQQAIKLITEQVNNPKFYIFTNDYNWAEEQFDSVNINKIIITHNRLENSFLDMILMSYCKHNICANSSFSWWGAWLNQHADKIVIAPKQWFKNQEHTLSTYDMIPENWLQI